MLKTTSKLIIAIDCDDVLIDTSRATLPFYNQLFGKDVAYHQLIESDEKIFGISDKQLFSAWKQFAAEKHDTIEPIPGAAAALDELLWHDAELHLVTARSDFLRTQTLELLEAYGMLHFFSTGHIHFVGKSGEILHPSKVAVCRSIGAAALVDDMPHHARDVAATGTEVLLMERPWNLGVEAPGIRRVTSWEEIKEVLVAKMAA